MADIDNNPDSGRGAGDRAKQDPTRRNPSENNEWLQDQIGEDHNLSGSDTYRTLPDQPTTQADDEGARDASDRQSNR